MTKIRNQSFVKQANLGKNLEEYKNCKNDEEIAEVIKRDCKGRGLLELK
jgi:hypothetical protein